MPTETLPEASLRHAPIASPSARNDIGARAEPSALRASARRGEPLKGAKQSQVPQNNKNIRKAILEIASGALRPRNDALE